MVTRQYVGLVQQLSFLLLVPLRLDGVGTKAVHVREVRIFFFFSSSIDVLC